MNSDFCVTRNIFGYLPFWDSLFATVSKDEILAVNEAAALINTKKLRQKLAFRRLLVGRKKKSSLNLQQIIKMIPKTLSFAR